MFPLFAADPSRVDPLLLLLAALALDACIGDPAAIFRRLPHPVVLMGLLIGRLEQHLNRQDHSDRDRRLGGIATTWRRSPPPSTAKAWPAAALRSATSSVAIPRASMGMASAVPPSNPWPRISVTASWRQCSGSWCWACRGFALTRPSTPSTA